MTTSVSTGQGLCVTVSTDVCVSGESAPVRVYGSVGTCMHVRNQERGSQGSLCAYVAGTGSVCVGSDRELRQLDIHTLLCPGQPLPCPRPGSASQRILELLRRPHPSPSQSPRQETGAFRGSRGPNSVTRSLHSFSTGNLTLQHAPPQPCSPMRPLPCMWGKAEVGSLVLEDLSEEPQSAFGKP